MERSKAGNAAADWGSAGSDCSGTDSTAGDGNFVARETVAIADSNLAAGKVIARRFGREAVRDCVVDSAAADGKVVAKETAATVGSDLAAEEAVARRFGREAAKDCVVADSLASIGEREVVGDLEAADFGVDGQSGRSDLSDADAGNFESSAGWVAAS